MPPLEEVSQLRTFLGCINGREPLRRIAFEIGELIRRMVHMNDAFEAQLFGLAVEMDHRKMVPKPVLVPVDPRGSRRDVEAGLKHPLVGAVTGANHDAMRAECDRPPVGVAGGVTYGESRHLDSLLWLSNKHDSRQTGDQPAII